ncbi:recombinase family protein [Pseudoflavonifractor sp. 60]|uniref:recombinase family protein n=1 Tax=Pseudoflavonifractor sp. 60 TaxID=2304576 RepID=UPI0013689648|nr:recombinase family protein [Pseudoflavonifractor sp. 60]NBI67907.1 recombinase family protein [Pseudoflavonifractor sp. 60]
MYGGQQTSGNLALAPKKVIVIEAAQRPEAQKLRVAAYCRVSSDSSDQLNSFMAQLNRYTTLISGKENWTLVDLYADEGISGTSAEKRPDFQRLISDCRRGKIDKVLVKSISRFARNAKDCLETIRELKTIGVGVHFEEQNIDTSNMTGELLTAVFAAIAQKESESLSAKMRWSYQYRMESGTYLPSSMPFGYIIRNKKIEIDESRAEIVRQIFQDYLAGQSIDEIAERLNREQVPVKIGWESRKWTHSAISYILSNERYIGDSLWQKTYTPDILSAHHVRNHGERKQYYAEGTHPAIITQETFQAVQRLKNQRREKRISESRSQDTPLRKKMFCAVCGTMFKRRMWGGQVYWVCRTHFHNKEDCPVTQIAENDIQAAFLRVYHKLRLHGEPILKQMIFNLQTIRERRMLWSLDIIELNKRISDIMDQEQMLTTLNKCGCVDPDIYISQSNELAQQLRAAKQEKERLLGSECDDTIPKTQELLETLETMPDFLPAFDGDIFRDLVEHVIAESSTVLRFRLVNGLELTESLGRKE